MAESFSRHDIQPHSRAILLLCASFERSSPDQAKSLSPREYARLSEWLQTSGLSADDLLGADRIDILSRDGLPIAWPRIYALLERHGQVMQHINSWTSMGGWILTSADLSYPQRLLRQSHFAAPPILYGIGALDPLTLGGLAIVGSRHADVEAMEYTRLIASSCAVQGITVVSGGARGVDSTAMATALQAGGCVLGILSDQLATTAALPLYKDALRSGKLVLISSHHPNSGFTVGNAMGRNKYIYALADWGLIVSTSLEAGGTWAGAVEALKHGRRVFVRNHGTVPDGNRALLGRGAVAFPSAWPRLSETLMELTDTQHRQRTAYDLVLKTLLSLLEHPSELSYLAHILDVSQAQVQAWLKRAIREGRIERIEKSEPAQYRCSRQQRMPFVAEGDGDYQLPNLAEHPEEAGDVQ